MTASSKKYAFILFVLLLFFLPRLINFTILPIFNDESTYIRYGLYELNQPSHQPYSLLIGKEPLLPYLYAAFGSGFGDLLVGARFVTIIFGALTLLGLFLFTKSLLGRRVALFASLFYCVSPFTVFFDRLALLDSPVATIAVWSLYFTNFLFQKNRWWYALGLGFVTGIGLWVKTSDLFYLFLPLISYLIYFFVKGDRHGTKAKRFALAFVIAIIIFLPLFTNPFYAVHRQLLQQYTYPWYSIFLFPFTIWWNNFVGVVEWLFFYLTPPLFLLAVISLLLFRFDKKLWLVALWFYLPFVYEVLYAKLFTARQALLLTIPLFVFAGYGFSLLIERKKMIGIILGVCIFVWSLFDISILLTSPQQYQNLFADRASGDMSQYVHGFSSGYGVKEAIDYLEQASQTQRIVVLIRNDHGNPEDAMVAYLSNKPTILMGLMNNPTVDVPQVFAQVGTSIPVYYVARGGYNAGLEKYFVSEKIFAKPDDKEYVGVALLKPAK
jgi:4-amino-4-deoxy-L-arabinose transferase-like glycosyltransferase